MSSAPTFKVLPLPSGEEVEDKDGGCCVVTRLLADVLYLVQTDQLQMLLKTNFQHHHHHETEYGAPTG